jgi:predicted enzyme related to lactoylglutathione lyase
MAAACTSTSTSTARSGGVSIVVVIGAMDFGPVRTLYFKRMSALIAGGHLQGRSCTWSFTPPIRYGRAAFYAQLLHWRAQVVRAAAGSYLAFDTGGHAGGGVVECGTARPVWLPYVEVDQIVRSTERALELGAVVLLEPREGPSGWRSVVSSPQAGEIALWEAKQ